MQAGIAGGSGPAKYLREKGLPGWRKTPPFSQSDLAESVFRRRGSLLSFTSLLLSIVYLPKNLPQTVSPFSPPCRIAKTALGAAPKSFICRVRPPPVPAVFANQYPRPPASALCEISRDPVSVVATLTY